MSEGLPLEQFELLKQRIHAARNYVRNSDEVAAFEITLDDGRKLTREEVIHWLEAAEKFSWSLAPADRRYRHQRWAMRNQPNG